MSETDLKACAFCGGRAERVDIADGENAGGSCVCCTQCLASSNVEFGFKENFISNWNRRAAGDEITRLRFALEWALDHASDHPHYPYREGDKWTFPYLVSNAGGFGGGVGNAYFPTALEAVEAAVPLTALGEPKP